MIPNIQVHVYGHERRPNMTTENCSRPLSEGVVKQLAYIGKLLEEPL